MLYLSVVFVQWFSPSRLLFRKVELGKRENEMEGERKEKKRKEEKTRRKEKRKEKERKANQIPFSNPRNFWGGFWKQEMFIFLTAGKYIVLSIVCGECRERGGGEGRKEKEREGERVRERRREIV